MTDEEDYGSILDEEEIEVEVRKPVGVVVSVRFSGDEMLALRGAVRESGGMMTSFIREAVLARVTERQPHRRGRQPTQQRDRTVTHHTHHALRVVSVSARRAGGGQYQTAQISTARVTGLPAVLRGGQPPI